MNRPGDVARVRVSTALGEYLIAASARGVRAVSPAPGIGSATDSDTADARALAHARSAADALRRHAAGDRAPFRGAWDVDGTPFERAVWERLCAIPFGATTTYGEMAAALGLPGEARAVGAAIAANPVCVLVPCHRVVGADGSLRGFAWGLDLKRRLLAHEGSRAGSLFAS